MIFVEGLVFEKNPIYIIPEEIENDIETNIVKECRICLESTEEENNKLLSICECKGTMKYIHKECVLKWIKERKGDCTCELCKTKYNKEELELKEIIIIGNKLYYCCKNLILIVPFLIVLVILITLITI